MDFSLIIYGENAFTGRQLNGMSRESVMSDLCSVVSFIILDLIFDFTTNIRTLELTHVLRTVSPRRCAFSSATAHKHKTNSLSPSCFFNAGAGQRLKHSAWPVHFNEAGLASSRLLVARHGAYRLIRHTLARFLPKRKTKKTKNTITLQQKTKQLSLQQNDCRPSRSRATQRFLVRPLAFFGAVSPSVSHHTRLPSRARAPQETTHTPSKRNARIRCASTQK